MKLVKSKYFVARLGDGNHPDVRFYSKMSVADVDISDILPEAEFMVGKTECWPVIKHPKKKGFMAVLFSPPIFGDSVATNHQDWMWLSENSIKTI